MTHAALHPCPNCEGKKNVFEQDASPRTLETISDNFRKWQEESGKKSTLKNYYNCSNEPLLIGEHDLSTPVLNIVPPSCPPHQTRNSEQIVLGTLKTVSQTS